MGLGENVPGRGQHVGVISNLECVSRDGEEVSVAGVDGGTRMEQ